MTIMEALRIEILNPKAMKLIRGMQDLELIKVEKETKSAFRAYLEKTRKNYATAPSLEQITHIVEEERSKRYAKKKK